MPKKAEPVQEQEAKVTRSRAKKLEEEKEVPKKETPKKETLKKDTLKKEKPAEDKKGKEKEKEKEEKKEEKNGKRERRKSSAMEEDKPKAKKAKKEKISYLPGLPIPFPILTDSYKATHLFQYPAAKKMVAYGEFRRSFQKDEKDERMVCYGLRYIIETYIARQWSVQDVNNAEIFFKTHNSGFSQFPFPKDLFLKFIEENDGYFPVKIESPPEGSVCYPHIPIYQITAEGEYSRLVTYLETILTMVWYPSTVATLSRRVHTLVKAAFEKSVDEEGQFLLASRLQDFGFRGCTSVEQSVIGGVAHLLSFEGSDTMTASYYAQFHLNQGRPVGTSIPATEHSVMTSYLNEKLAIENMIGQFGSGVFAVVMDSYDYVAALEKILPSVAQAKIEKGGFMVLRPDSGNPVDVVLQALRAGEKIFGYDLNKKGYKVLKGVGVIQGDGIDPAAVSEILEKALEEKFSAQNICFGMGGGLLQKVNRDTMSFATKLSHIIYEDGTERNVMKAPKTDPGKFSLPGELKVAVSEQGLPVVYPKGAPAKGEQNLLKVVYDHGPVEDVWDDFDTVRKRLNEEWAKFPPVFDVISPEMKQLIEETREAQLRRNAESVGPLAPMEED